MASLTTTNGTKYSFDPAAVIAVTGTASATVFGIAAGELQIAETPAAFLARIGVAANFTALTRPDDSPILINCKAVSSVRSPVEDEYPESANAVISLGSLTQAVEETPDQVTRAIASHGGSL